jgi:nucleoside-diphosphate-sugar epimerase
MKRILITGANGFVGRYLVQVLAKADYDVCCGIREGEATIGDCQIIAVGNINGTTDWREALNGVDCVVHLAARAHMIRDTAADSLAAFRAVNVDGSANLAKQAAANGVRRFIFLSSIKVNGERTFGRPFAADDAVHPEDPYAISKWEAEQALRQICAATNMELVVIRPPLIYGPGVKGNLQRLLRLIERGWPLPLGSIQNSRSLVGIGNLCDLIRLCIEHPAAAGEVFLASDGEDISTPQLLRYLAAGVNKPLMLLPVPVHLLVALGKILGAGAAIARLTGDLRVDITKNRELLGWAPSITFTAGISKMTVAYLQAKDGCKPSTS